MHVIYLFSTRVINKLTLLDMPNNKKGVSHIGLFKKGHTLHEDVEHESWLLG